MHIFNSKGKLLLNKLKTNLERGKILPLNIANKRLLTGQSPTAAGGGCREGDCRKKYRESRTDVSESTIFLTDGVVKTPQNFTKFQLNILLLSSVGRARGC